jgi:hypothetical protein
MKFQSFRSAVVFASVMVASVTASQAFAQAPIDVLTGSVSPGFVGFSTTSTYKFTGSMILNSIGFYTNGKTPQSLSYSVKGTTYNVTNFSDPNLGAVVNGFRWLTISPESMLSNEIVTVTTLGSLGKVGPNNVIQTQIYQSFTVNSSANVSYDGLVSNGATLLATFSNSNLRVSSPTSNVAPEPGSFALALTGGAALLGICIRRRRNAA